MVLVTSTLCPRVIPTLSGDAMGQITAASGSRHFVRLVTWIPG